MREIIFRGKDLQEHNGWLYGYFYKSDINKRERESGKATFIFTPNCDTFIYVPEYHNSWMVKAETVGQYTGLTDKNGKQIFEGDILGAKHPKQMKAVPFLVKYGEYEDEDGLSDCRYLGFCLQALGKCCSILTPLSDGIEYEVIGNIHDNPELLERGAKNE